ncbi:MAG: zinc ABC transporter substrate-binding protein [Paracoccaceae bacterium]|nr:zinc ABC transporter substrate-binding protein [Paracoccaceae bacterium]
MLTRRNLLALFSASALLPGLAQAETEPGIVATTGMIADAARRIGGGAVTALMGPGLDPHGYRQTRSDIATLARADLVLWHGLFLEAQMQDFLSDLARTRRVVAVADALPRDLLRANPIYPDRFDPHVWMDPSLWALVVDVVCGALDELLPQAATAHAANRATFKTEITALDTYARAVLATVPAEARVLVTAHDAFGYFGRAYGFQVEGIQGLSTESEAGLVRIGALVDLLVARRVPAVFVESSVSDRSVRALVEGAAAKGHKVVIGGELYSDAMGPDGSYEGTWLGMIDHNATLIARALGGQTPPNGRLGKLAAAA